VDSTVTGQVAKHGYVNIDGLDSSLGMINAAKLKKIYKWVYCTRLKGWSREIETI
jgi:hypothetical protein